MKKNKFLLLFILTFLLIPITYACKSQPQKIQLSTPSFVNMIDEEDKRILVTDNNINASGYVFGICSNEVDKQDLTKYIRYNSSKNFLDVTNIFTNSTTYYFYCQAIGTNNFTNSLYSATNSYDNTKYLSTPTLYAKGYVLNWSNIDKAISYDIYLNNEFLLNTTQNTLNLQTYNNGGYLTSSTALSFKIKAKPQQISGYRESKFSNLVTISKHLTPSTPTISISSSEALINSKVYLTWQDISNEIFYKLKVVGTDINYYTLSKNSTTVCLNELYEKDSLESVNLLNNLGNYTFSLIAIGENNNNSEYSNEVSLKVYSKQNICKISNISKTESSLEFYVNIPDNNITFFNIKILDNSNNICYKADYEVLSLQIKIILSNLDILNFDNINQIIITSNGIGEYLKPSESIKYAL